LADLKHYNIQIYDLLHSSKPDMLKSWQVNWLDSSKRKGRTYASSQPIIPLKPWFSKFQKTSKLITSVLCRVRLGHCCSPVFLNKIRIRDSSLCECGLDEGSIDHIFLNCPLNNAYSLDHIINKLKIPRPVNVRHLLSLFPNPHIVKAFIKYIDSNNIKL